MAFSMENLRDKKGNKERGRDMLRERNERKYRLISACHRNPKTLG